MMLKFRSLAGGREKKEKEKKFKKQQAQIPYRCSAVFWEEEKRCRNTHCFNTESTCGAVCAEFNSANMKDLWHKLDARSLGTGVYFASSGFTFHRAVADRLLLVEMKTEDCACHEWVPTSQVKVAAQCTTERKEITRAICIVYKMTGRCTSDKHPAWSTWYRNILCKYGSHCLSLTFCLD